MPNGNTPALEDEEVLDSELPESHEEELDAELPDEGSDEQEEEQPTGDPLKDTKAELTRTKQANATMRREMDEMKGQMKALLELQSSRKEQDAEPQEEKDPLDEFQDSILDSPENTIKALKTMRQQIATLLQHRDPAIIEQAVDRALKRYDNRGDDYKVAMLRKKHPEMATLPDEALRIFAKTLTKEKPDAFRGGIGGAGRGGERGRVTEEDRQIDAISRQFERRMRIDDESFGDHK